MEHAKKRAIPDILNNFNAVLNQAKGMNYHFEPELPISTKAEDNGLSQFNAKCIAEDTAHEDYVLPCPK